ncbi:hypothetical protein [Polaribacter sp. KT25b]|uniref:hypothetical protein n=1 Tax=Polaribacter sp. KT25b TaxID=1855336 RepID=UPI000B82833D|nr:hypothetical protein [Polaribacter sp. KT25b]
MMNFQQYISHFSIKPTTLEEWKEARKSYRKYYQKEYLKTYRNNSKRIEILFSNEEYETIKNIAKKYDEKPTTFIRKSSLAYIQSEAFLPINENIEEAKMLIRKSSNNINQLVFMSHSQKNISEGRFSELIKQVNQLENIVNTLYVSPKINFKPIHLIPNLNAD